MNLSPEPVRKNGKGKNFFTLLIKVVISCMIIASLIVVGQYAFKLGYQYVQDPKDLEEKNGENNIIEVKIPKGASTREIAVILKEKGLIKYPILFRVVSKINRNDGKYQQGIHHLNTAMDYEAIMAELQKNVEKKETKRFTIPEGFEFRQIVEKLANEKLIDKEKFINIAENGDFDYPFLKNLPKRENRLEGYLFPDTYEVYADATEEDIIKKMLDRFEQVFNQEYYEKAKALNMTVDEVVTLASIIEREAQVDKERPLVSAVFHNRLKSKNYPYLQSCATVQYILKDRKKILTDEDTKTPSPYNTYLHPGLPIGPIASPGKASIHAALYPADVDYLFFVAKDDGTHIYSKTYAEHLKAVSKVQQGQ
ncbi:MAG: hypothetical protein PWP27_28 [Clostridiales bacterium]|nr:hypothetical protein [Clostridiales bacterium]MDK2932218.1 hypothetical protein [Clostridiales bacterium]